MLQTLPTGYQLRQDGWIVHLWFGSEDLLGSWDTRQDDPNVVAIRIVMRVQIHSVDRQSFTL